MRFIYLILLLISMPVVAVDGKALHDAVCIQCHASLTNDHANSFYQTVDRKVKTFSALQKQVKGCAMAADANWTDQQRAAVVRYLSDNYYHFSN